MSVNPGALSRRRVTGLPSLNTHYTDLMRDGRSGLRLLWSLKHTAARETRRPLLREHAQNFPVGFADWMDSEPAIDAALAEGAYLMSGPTGVPRIAGVLEPAGDNQAVAYAGMPAQNNASRNLAKRYRGENYNEGVDILGFPTLFISSAKREDPFTGAKLLDQDYYSNVCWRSLNLWPYESLSDVVG